MRKITLICFGKLRTDGLDQAVNEFTKRLSKYTDFKTIELKPQVVSEKSASVRLQNQIKEAEELKKLTQHSKVVWCLDETGKSLKTTDWADDIKNYQQNGISEMTFVIGSGLGLHKDFIKSCDKIVSFGAQTLSHEIARLVFVEQTYRVLSYLSGHPYHNEG